MIVVPFALKEINHYKSLENNINWIDINDLEVSKRISAKVRAINKRRSHQRW